MAWRNCNASLTLVDAADGKWPGRDTRSDGTIGDAAHATRDSDHNPWMIVAGWGVVRARDIDVDGIDAAWLAEELRKLGAAGNPRLAGGGYIIFNRRITKADFSGWSVYTGSNPHTGHIHVSFSRNVAGFDSTAPWPFLTNGGSFMAALSDAAQIKLAGQVDQIATVLGHAFEGDGNDIGTKVKDMHGWLKPIERYGADGKIVLQSIRQEIADIKTQVLQLEDRPDVDEMSPDEFAAAVAAAVPDSLAERVVEALGQRISGAPKQ